MQMCNMIKKKKSNFNNTIKVDGTIEKQETCAPCTWSEQCFAQNYTWILWKEGSEIHVIASKMKSLIKAEPLNHFRGRHPLFKQEQRRILGADAAVEWRVWVRIDARISKIDNVYQPASLTRSQLHKICSLSSLAIFSSFGKTSCNLVHSTLYHNSRNSIYYDKYFNIFRINFCFLFHKLFQKNCKNTWSCPENIISPQNKRKKNIPTV